VVEAVALDALRRALPPEQRSVIVGAGTEPGREVTGGVVERLAVVLLPVHRQLFLEPGDALAKCMAFGLPRRGIRQAQGERALTFGRRCYLTLGELETLALKGDFPVVAARAAAQQAA
jgi:hypothetical protein